MSSKPTRTQIILCWVLFTGAMALFSVIAHIIVPPTIGAAQHAIGVGPLGILMFVGWVGLLVYGFRPLLARRLARRREARIRQR